MDSDTSLALSRAVPWPDALLLAVPGSNLANENNISECDRAARTWRADLFVHIGPSERRRSPLNRSDLSVAELSDPCRAATRIPTRVADDTAQRDPARRAGNAEGLGAIPRTKARSCLHDVKDTGESRKSYALCARESKLYAFERTCGSGDPLNEADIRGRSAKPIRDPRNLLDHSVPYRFVRLAKYGNQLIFSRRAGSPRDSPAKMVMRCYRCALANQPSCPASPGLRSTRCLCAR